MSVERELELFALLDRWIWFIYAEVNLLAPDGGIKSTLGIWLSYAKVDYIAQSGTKNCRLRSYLTAFTPFDAGEARVGLGHSFVHICTGTIANWLNPDTGVVTYFLPRECVVRASPHFLPCLRSIPDMKRSAATHRERRSLA